MTKTRLSGRAVALQAIALEALDQIGPRQDSPLLFPTARGGHLDFRNFTGATGSRCRRRSGTSRRATSYDLRHTVGVFRAWGRSLRGAAAHSRLDSFEAIERLIGVEMRLPTLPRGFVPHLAQAARRGGPPVVHDAAAALQSREGGRVVIFTGIVVRPYLELGETDGIVGSVVLARALRSAGYTVEMLVETRQVEPMRRLCDASQVRDVNVRETGASVDAEPADIAIAIEKIAKNAQGVRHSLLGTPLTEMADEVDAYFIELREAGIPTVGIGDGGNEIGFGSIAEEVADVLGEAAQCACGCAGGVVSATPTQFVVAAATANLGTYALLAALALATERGQLCAEPGDRSRGYNKSGRRWVYRCGDARSKLRWRRRRTC